jgi:hypothetical protein
MRGPKTIEMILAEYPAEWARFQEDQDFSDYGPLYEALYEYFCNTGEMPYGVMKARTGDPDIWIRDRIVRYIEKDIFS